MSSRKRKIEEIIPPEDLISLHEPTTSKGKKQLKKESKKSEKKKVKSQSINIATKSVVAKPVVDKKASKPAESVAAVQENSLNVEIPKKKKKKTKKEKRLNLIANLSRPVTAVVTKPPDDNPTVRKKWNIEPTPNAPGVAVVKPKQVGKSSGVKVTDYIVGAGPEPDQGALVKIVFEGMFPDGTIFDARMKRKDPLIFRRGIGQVVRGLDLGIEGMRIGGAREIVVPPELG